MTPTSTAQLRVGAEPADGTEPGATRKVPKTERKRLAKAELLLQAAGTTQRWADDLTGKNRTAPFSEWGNDDPFVSLCRRYDLTPTDLATLAEGIAQQLEARAERAGYGEAWL